MARVERLASAPASSSYSASAPPVGAPDTTDAEAVRREVAQIQGLCAQMDRLWCSIPAKGKRDLWKRAKVRETVTSGGAAGDRPAAGQRAPVEAAHNQRRQRRTSTQHNEEVVGEDICCAEMENAVFHTRDHLSVVLHQFPIEDNGCGQQPGLITQPIEQDVSDAVAHLHDNVEQKVMDHSFSSLDPIDQVCNHQRSLDDTSISDVNKCSVGNELPLSSVSRSCDDHTDNNEYRYPEVVQVNTLESIKHVEESSPINELNADVRCTLVVMQPDSCGSTDKICTSFEEVVQVPVEVQPDSLVCHDVKTKDILLHMNIEQAAIGYNFSDDKTLDLPHTANFGAQDGQLENVVYDALNNHVQQECFETKTSVGVPDTVVILSPPTVANVSHDGHLLLANMDESSKDMNQQSGTMNVDICRSVDDQEPREAYVFNVSNSNCVNMDKTECAISDSSSNPGLYSLVCIFTINMGC
ncbi:hypothetical protein ZWY2020_008048 [Hordeum vulgare]|nr:hypothetical protein ZWY2020_008048 [Hordeum vulgare]